MMKRNSHNKKTKKLNDFEKLPPETIGIIYLLLNGKIEDYNDVYMVEIKKDDPLKHIKEENENFIIHNHPNQYRNKAKHLYDNEWIVVHREDCKILENINHNAINEIVKKYINEK